MKISCQCGHLIPDQTDALPNKAHLVPDQAWFGLKEALDEIIAGAADGKTSKEEAQHAAALVLVQASRPLYQCPSCGSILIDGPQRTVSIFRPAGDAPAYGILNG